jgi:hypothetical protein
MEFDLVSLREKGGNTKCVNRADLTYLDIFSGALSTQMSYHTALDQPITGSYLLCFGSLPIYGSAVELWTYGGDKSLHSGTYRASAITTLHEEVYEFTTLLLPFFSRRSW